ncbi:membrane-associated phospholipid phosphatase [Phyllobacterium myrsinacearum]|uniref:Membrane-associated phospholipid phosphatase n=1 Tax=Phyllobacterium myrsinacearum TaxID=28101 RepID=A0A839EJI9_9HYPH|nr:membrane-associated phospholipid phosphatase [Phyllobacterium myrsinacearum]
MTLAEYNRCRYRAKRYSLILFCSFVGASLSAAGQNLPFVVIFGLGFGVAAGLLAIQIKHISAFSCPRCGKDPLTWVSSDPNDADGATYDSLSTICLNCKFDLQT